MRIFSALCFSALFSTFASAVTVPQYAARQDIATPLQKLGYLAIADFNGDGKPDLAVTSSLDKQILIYLNKGDGTFGTPLSVTLDIDNTAGALVSGDFNEDGKQDLIVATIAGDQQNILLTGNGDGTFTRQASLPDSFGFLSASVGDINNDGHLDLVAGGNGSLYVYLGDGHGNFTNQPFPNQGPSGAFFGVTLADFNKDHNLDLITDPYGFGNSGSSPAGIGFYAGAGNGSFANPAYSTANYIFSPYQFASADFDGDGNLDLLFSQPNVATVLFGNGDGTFKLDPSQTAGFYVADPDTTAIAPPLIAATDMNADGKPDGIVADIVANSINVFINDGLGTFYGAASFSAALDPGTAAMQIADLNGDGLPDIVLVNYLTQKISVFLSVPQQVASSINVTASAAQSIAGAPLTLTAKITTVGTVPTGTVTLLDGSANIAQMTLDTTGQATFTVSTLAVGQHALSVQYSGDKNYTATTSSTLNEAVTDFQVALSSPATQTVTAGSTATYTLALTPITGLMGTATLSCSGLPSTYTCANTTVALNGQPATGSISVVTAATQQARLEASSTPSIYAAFFGLPCLMLGVTLRRRRTPVLPAVFSFVLLATCLGILAGCGGHSNSGSSNPVTTSFTINVSVTQAGQTLTHSVPATITVQ